jgi:uncharacterized protein
MMRLFLKSLFFCFYCIFFFCLRLSAQKDSSLFRVVGFYTAKNDPAHISFVHEANSWFAKTATAHHFIYDSTSNWENLNAKFLSPYQLVIFLDTRPDSLNQRQAFEKYMKNGGAWIGFHFSAFALDHSKYPQDWDWYHNEFLCSGQYMSNTWRPTSAQLRVEKTSHPVTKELPAVFTSSPNEWYRWKNDLRKNQDIEILVSIDSTSFPLGTGPKKHEIWHSGDYPVVWTNTKYKMVYFNMGHNDIDYENGTNKELSQTFGNQQQDQVVLNAIKWLASKNQISLFPGF